MKPTKGQKQTLEDIFGGNFKKLDELKGKTFDIISFTSDKVKGYKTLSLQVKIKIDGKENVYSTFSGIVLRQLQKMTDNDLLPAKDCTLVEREGKESGNNYLSFQLASDDEEEEEEE